MVRVLLSIFCVIAFWSCDSCEEQSEPLIWLTTDNEYEYVVIQNSKKTTEEIFFSNRLSLSLNSDTVTYFFMDSLKIIEDTLSFSYTRNFDFESDNCGFTVQLDEFKLLPESSFKEANFYIDEGYPGVFGGYNNVNSYSVTVR